MVELSNRDGLRLGMGYDMLVNLQRKNQRLPYLKIGRFAQAGMGHLMNYEQRVVTIKISQMNEL